MIILFKNIIEISGDGRGRRGLDQTVVHVRTGWMDDGNHIDIVYDADMWSYPLSTSLTLRVGANNKLF